MTGWGEEIVSGGGTTVWLVSSPSSQLLACGFLFTSNMARLLSWHWLGYTVLVSVVSNIRMNVSAMLNQPMNGWKMHVLLVSAAPISHLNEWECTLSHWVIGRCIDNTGSVSLESKDSIQHRWSLLCLQLNHCLHSLHSLCILYIYSFYP